MLGKYYILHIIIIIIIIIRFHVPYFFSWFDIASGPRPSHSSGSSITLRHTTFGRTPVDE